MTVRKLVGDDAAIFREVRLEGLRNHPEAFAASFDEEARHPLDVISQRLRDGAVFGGFGCNHALDGVVGVAKGQSAKVRHIATIWGMYVRPAARGTGLAAKLLNAAIAEALLDCRSIRLSVVSTHEAARRLYARAGFQEWAVHRAALNIDGAFFDEVLMRLDAG
jgi:GNAT superfamily N-acetyltransferase